MNIEEIKQRVDCHDLAAKLGLERPGNKGNYRSPHHKDKNPSLHIHQDGRYWKDYSRDVGGSCIDLWCYVKGVEDVSTAVQELHDLYGLPRKEKPQPDYEYNVAEYVASKVLTKPSDAIPYLTDKRAIPEAIIKRAITSRTLGFSDYVNKSRPWGQPGHRGDAVAFIVRDRHTGKPVAVDSRFITPETNGGLKQHCTGEKSGHLYVTNWNAVKRAKTLFVCESPINALSIEAAEIPYSAAVAVRGAGAVIEQIDWRFAYGKQVIGVFDWDKPDEKGYCPGQQAGWKLHEVLTQINISCLLIDQHDWAERKLNDINDLLQKEGVDAVRTALKNLQDYLLPGLPGSSDHRLGRSRLFLPEHDFQVYRRFRVKRDFTSYSKSTEEVKDDDGNTVSRIDDLIDVCGFRIVSISRVTIAGHQSVLTGDEDLRPETMLAVVVQSALFGSELRRASVTPKQLHSMSYWEQFGAIYTVSLFKRMLTVMERTVAIGAQYAVNYVGLAWFNAKLIVNQGTDCYFSDPRQQCRYHNLSFPSGPVTNARRVILAYQKTFTKNAASQLLIWSLGCHLKAQLGFWPHAVVQARKGSGKTTLIKRLERTIGFTMLSGRSIETAFRLMTSVAHTSHPIGWEEISARDERTIKRAVDLLQETYQYSVTYNNTEMREFLLSAPVLLAGEDVPVQSLIQKTIQFDLVNRKGDLLDDDLPVFPVLEWLEFLTHQSRQDVIGMHKANVEDCMKVCIATEKDDGAKRMVTNYAVLLTSWQLLCRFVDLPEHTGGFGDDLIENMNEHVKESTSDREPWIWICETILSEIDSHQYSFPHAVRSVINNELDLDIRERLCLILRPSHMIDHLAHQPRLKAKFNAMPIKTHRVFKQALLDAGVVHKLSTELSDRNRRYGHMLALDVEALERYGLVVSIATGDSYD